jgi:hypothetical protein
VRTNIGRRTCLREVEVRFSSLARVVITGGGWRLCKGDRLVNQIGKARSSHNAMGFNDFQATGFVMDRVLAEAKVIERFTEHDLGASVSPTQTRWSMPVRCYRTPTLARPRRFTAVNSIRLNHCSECLWYRWSYIVQKGFADFANPLNSGAPGRIRTHGPLVRNRLV